MKSLDIFQNPITNVPLIDKLLTVFDGITASNFEERVVQLGKNCRNYFSGHY